MKLFEINNALLNCVKLEDRDEYLDMSTGEIIDVAAIEQLQMDRNTKIRNIACWIKNLESDEEQLDKQEKIYKGRKMAARNKKERLKRYLASVLSGEKWENPEVKIGWRQSESIVLNSGFNINNLPKQYLKYKEPDINKTLLKKDLKNGVKINGVQLVTKNNIQIN